MKDLNKKKWWYIAGVPICLVAVYACMLLAENTYKSTFIIAKESENAPDHEKVLNISHGENYNLGILRGNNAFDRYTYSEMLKSDKMLRPLLNAHVATLDGQFDGTYYTYMTVYRQKNRKKSIGERLGLLPEEKTYSQDSYPAIHWESKNQESVVKKLYKSLKVEMDNQTELVTITCTMHDPLVATMMAEAVQQSLINYIKSSQQEQMQQALDQLNALTTQAKTEWEMEKTSEKENLYLSLQRQQVVYQSQMLFAPSIVTIAEPSFSYYKAGPSRAKISLLVTVLLGLIVWSWNKRREIVAFFHED